MPEPWLLAVDLGNGGPKVAAVSEGGDILGAAFEPVDVRIGLDGTATQDPSQWWDRLLAAARSAVDGAGVDGDSLRAVGLTGQWGTTVPVGADGLPVGEAILWADTRGGRYAREVIGGPISVQGYAPHKVLPFIRATGGAPSPSGADPTGHSLLLQRDFPEVHAAARWLMEPLDYLGLRLTGRAATTPATMTASWLTDNRVGAAPAYVDALVRRARRDRSKLPELMPSASVLGDLLPHVADAIGVRHGAPVVVGLPDLHAAIVGSGAVRPFESHLAVSTTAWISARVPFKRTDITHSIATVPGLDADLPVVANNHETGGAALQWLRQQVLGGEATYDELTALAADVPAGSEGVVFTPWLNGERSPVDDKEVRAAFLGVSLRTDRAILVRAVLEGVAYNARWLLDPYERFLRRPVPSLRILGGGAQSDLWCQLHADVLDRTVEQVADPRHAQLRGVALWARVVLGELTLEQAAALVPVARRFGPGGQPVYREGYRRYRELYKRLAPISRTP